MQKKEYQRIKEKGNILNFNTLQETAKQLRKINSETIALEIDRILDQNKIQKPELHNQQNEITTTFYLVDLNFEHIETIISMFVDLEVTNLDVNYEVTGLASYYASLADKWNKLSGNN